ncbi:MAG: peptidylprolyl isomerase [Deltaproteobacteria bacterium]|nr:peptidylprolyl isomerase [Deltaproteobacteria bacterium]
MRSARVFTSQGEIRIQLLPEVAPLTVWNFATLAESGYFAGLVFHRVVPDFVVQTGDPRGDGWGGPGYEIPDELSPESYDVGAVGMALSGPDTGGSQWFVTLSPQPHLDYGYTLFGRVTLGMRGVAAIGVGDSIERVVIERVR